MTELELDVRAHVAAGRVVHTRASATAGTAGLLVENPEGKRTRNSFLELTDSSREYDAWCSFYSEVAAMARAVEPTLLRAAAAGRRTWPRTWTTRPGATSSPRRWAR